MVGKIVNKVLANKHYADGTERVTKQYYRQNDETIHIDEVEQMVNTVKRLGHKKYDNFKVDYIKVLNGTEWRTFRSLQEFYDYFNNMVKEVSKFTEVYQIKISCIAR